MAIRPASRRAWFMRATAVVLAAGTARTIIVNLNELDTQANALGPIVTVVIARHDLALGMVVRASDVSGVPRHASQVPPHALRDPRLAIGRTVRVAMVIDTPIQVANLIDRTSPYTGAPNTGIPNAGIVAPGHRAMRVVDHGGMALAPGNVVDVIASFEPQTTLSTRAQAPNARVVARGAIVISDTDTQFSREDSSKFSDEPSSSGMIVLVQEDEAEAVAFATAFGVVSIVLAPTEEACCVAK